MSFQAMGCTYGPILDIMHAYKTAGGTGAWSYAENSNST
ncbi:uncharacterized protein FTOL_03057 [Fusarium torulosum]|uniref:Uncharacterized protein n=1 Tax=Fusarium torulosum TaxID=33205 RepID=A0AAE8M370_9HYPO|nr:uncharacterized protein FTOL_03057 [Fusarium torulosum]